MFNIILYKCGAEMTRIDKASALADALPLSGTLRESCSIVNPVVQVKQDVGVVGYNYAYIEEFNRYYFVTNVTSTYNGLWEIELHVDVLMSFKEGILNLNALVLRQENDYNLYLEDDDIPMEYAPTRLLIDPIMSKEEVGIFNVVGNTTDNYCCVMTVISQSPLDSTTGQDKGNYDGLLPLPSDSYSLQSKSTYMYVFNRRQLEAFMQDWVQRYSDFASYVISYAIYPFDVRKLAKCTKATEIRVGDYVARSIQGDFYTIDPHVYNSIKFVAFDINTENSEYIYHSFMDYTPYLKFQMFIPLYGFIELDPEDIYPRGYVHKLNGNIQIILEYVIDLLNGMCDIYIEKQLDPEYIGGGVPQLIKSVTCDIRTQLPVNTTTVADKERTNAYNRYVANTEIMTSATKGIAASLGAKSPAQGIGHLLGGAADAIKAQSMYQASKILNLARGVQSNARGDGFNIFRMPYHPFMYVDRITSPVFGNFGEIMMKDFARLHGFKLDEMRVLKNIHGFTMITDVHLENFIAVSEEKEEISQLLLSGVILP